jgi:hypothetical protein
MLVERNKAWKLSIMGLYVGNRGGWDDGKKNR